MTAPPPATALPPPPPALLAPPPQRVLVLVGIPGSGKSTAAAALEAAGWTRINQDTLGSRPACERAAAAALAAGRSVVVDRCNFDARQRAPWIALARAARVGVATLELRLPVEVCAARAAARADHPTIAPADAAAVVARMAADYVRVDARREGVDAAWVATSDGEVAAAVARAGRGRAGPPRADLAAWGRAAAAAAPAAAAPLRPAAVAPAVVPFARRDRPPQPGSLVPRHLDAPLGADPRPIVLFDLNDTLASSTAARRAEGRIRARPGAAALLPLKARLRFGLFTSATVPTVLEALPVLAAAAGGCLFDAADVAAATGRLFDDEGVGGAGAARAPPLILHRGHTRLSPTPRKAWATTKPLGVWFGAPSRVLVVDDDDGKVAPGERDNFILFPAWGQKADCVALPALATALEAHVASLGAGDDVRPAGRRVEAAVGAGVA